ncbi:MAG: hypothetical protein JWM52_697 [Candidatus Saccharibacteria bacterium]|nr:hypothetical protein [Candidatus Saccharibacteria bacterium]
MKVYIERLYKFLEQYGKYVPYISTLIPFLIGYISALFFAQGDMRAINYFISQIGIINFWLNGLVNALTIAVQLGAAILLVDYWTDVFRNKAKIETKKIIIGGGITGIAFGILSLSFFIGIIGGVLVGYTVGRIVVRTYRKKDKDPTMINFKSFYLIFGVYMLYISIAAYPNLPTTKLVRNNGDTLKVVILAEKEDHYLAQQEDKKIELFKKSDFKDQIVCTKNKSILDKTLFSAVSNKQLFEDC